MKSYSNKILIFFFLSALTIPMFVGLIKKDDEFSKNEKRQLAKFPETPSSIDSIGIYFSQFDDYYKDHYGFKEKFLSFYSTIKYLMYDSSSENIIIGKDRWLFLNKGYGSPMTDFMNTSPMSDMQIKNYGDYLQSKSNWFHINKMEFYFLMCPNKHSIYPEKIPKYIPKNTGPTNFDRLLQYLKTNTTVKVIFTKEILLEEKYKSEYPLYSPKGTHWTSLGANYAQFELAKTIEKDFPNNINPKLEDLSNFYWETSNYDSSGAIIGLPELQHKIPKSKLETCKDNFIVNGQDIKYTCTKNKGALNALIFRDSYFIEMVPYLTSYFANSNFIWKGLTLTELKKQLSLNTYDIVIESFVERYLEDKTSNLLEFAANEDLIKDMFDKSDDLIYESKCFNNWWLQFQEKEEGQVVKNCESLNFTISKMPITNIYLRNIDALKNSNVIAYFEYDSTIETTFKLFYSIKGESVNGWRYSEAKSIKSDVKIGANKIYIPIAIDNLDDSILFQLGGLDGSYKLKKVKLKKINLTN